MDIVTCIYVPNSSSTVILVKRCIVTCICLPNSSSAVILVKRCIVTCICLPNSSSAVILVWRCLLDRPMPPQFRKLRRPPLLLNTDRFQKMDCLSCLSAWCQFVSVDLLNAVVCFQPSSLLIGKVWALVIHSVLLCFLQLYMQLS